MVDHGDVALCCFKLALTVNQSLHISSLSLLLLPDKGIQSNTIEEEEEITLHCTCAVICFLPVDLDICSSLLEANIGPLFSTYSHFFLSTFSIIGIVSSPESHDLLQ